MSIENNEKTESELHVPTIIAISIIAWACFAFLHEVIGHGGSAIILGEKLQGAVTTTVHIRDFYNLDHVTERIGWWGFRFIVVAGTLVNLVTGFMALFFLNSKWVTNNPSLRYFLWFFATISIFQQAFWMTVMPFLGWGGDWTAFFIQLEYSVIWKYVITGGGLVLLWIGYYYPIRSFHPFNKLSLHERRPFLAKITIIPIIAVFIFQFLSVLWSPLSGPRHTIIVSIFSFIPLIIWLVFVNIIKWPGKINLDEIFILNRNVNWIIAGILVFCFFIFILGTGIGSFDGHPDYKKSLNKEVMNNLDIYTQHIC